VLVGLVMIRPAAHCLVLWCSLAVSSAASGLPKAIQNPFRFAAPGNIQSMAFDSAGNLYLAGVSALSIGNTSLPQATTIIGASQGNAVFIEKMSPSGHQILHLTLIGASFAGTILGGMAIDSKGDIFLAGGTNSPDFPTTPGTFQPASPTGGALLLELDPTGTRLIYSTYLDQGLSAYYLGTVATALAIDADGNAYIAGTTSGATFPTTNGALLRTVTTSPGDGNTSFISKFDPAGKLIASTLFGAPVSYENTYTTITAIAVDQTGVIHICGTNAGPDLLLTTNAPYSKTLLYYGQIGYLARLDSGASKLLFSTPLPFLPGAIAVDGAGDSIATGSIGLGFTGRLDAPGATAEIGAQGNLVYLDANTPGNILIVRHDGTALAAGTTSTPGFPTLDSLLPCGPNIAQTLPAGAPYPSLNGNGYMASATLTMLDASGNKTFATLLGGPGATGLDAVALDPSGNLYIVGNSPTAAQFPGGLVIDSSSGPYFVFKLDLGAVPHGSTAPTCLVNAATFDYAPATPGMLATLFGSNLGPPTGVEFQLDANGMAPTELAGVSVTVGGLPAPILYAQASQINFIVPQEVTGPTTNVCVTNAGVQSCVFAFVLPAWPGVFCMGPCNSFAVLNEDGSINLPGQGAAPGSAIMIFGTGMGLFDRMPADGSIVSGPLDYLAAPLAAEFVLPPNNCLTAPFCPATIYPATVLFAGAAPEEVLGLDQVNVLIPKDVPSGLAVPLWLISPASPVPAKLTVTIQ
jgi:uncharacterized protein (TIGR03437 family)